jgi:hypothetical protein
MRNPGTASRTSPKGSIIGPPILEPRKGPRQIHVAKFRFDTAYDTNMRGPEMLSARLGSNARGEK